MVMPSAAEDLHRRARDRLRRLDEMSEIVRLDIENVARRRLRDHQRMARRPRHDVEKGESLVVLVDLVRRQFAAQDFGKDVVRIVARHRALRLAHAADGIMLRKLVRIESRCDRNQSASRAKSLRNGPAAASSAPAAAT